MLRVTGDDAADDDVLTDALIERANATGRVLFTRTVLDGRVGAALLDRRPATEWRHVEAGWQLLQQLVPA